jgi:glycerol-3-phosphate acyltransferase PlsY
MVDMNATGWAISVLFAFVAGSIPFGVLIAGARGVDIREHGSKNIGATNVWRILGAKLGAICFVLDVLKGAIPVLVVGFITGTFGKQLDLIDSSEMLLWIAIALAALLGHMFSPWLKWKGGKGVATTFGGMVAMWPLLSVPILLALLVWLASLAVSKMVSLASIVAAVSLPIMTLCWLLWNTGFESLVQYWPMIALTSLIAGMVFWKHRSNIQRMARGEEPKLGTAPTPPEQE